MVRQSTCCRTSTMHHKRNQRDPTDRKSPKPRRRNVAKRTLSKNRIQVQRRRKAKPRLRKNCGQCSSCRSADSCVNLNKSYMSMYHTLFFLCEKQVHSEQNFVWFVTDIFSFFAHVPVFFHSFSMLIPTRRSIYLSLSPRGALCLFRWCFAEFVKNCQFSNKERGVSGRIGSNVHSFSSKIANLQIRSAPQFRKLSSKIAYFQKRNVP